MPGYRWGVLLACLLAFVAYGFAFQTVPPLMVTIVNTFKISNVEAGLLISLAVIPGIFLSVPASVSIDRFGIKLVGGMAAVLAASGCILDAAANSFPLLLLGRIILGTASVFIVINTPMIVSQWFPPKDLGKAMGIYATCMPLSVVSAFWVSSYLLLHYSWRYPLFVGALVSVVDIFVFALVVREGPLKNSQKENTQSWQGFKNIEVWKIGSIFLGLNAASLGFVAWAPTIFQNWLKMDPFYASILASMIMVMQIFFSPLFGLFSDRTGRIKPFILISSILFTLVLVATAFASIDFLVISVISLGILSSSFGPMLLSLPPSILGPKCALTGFCIMSICGSIGVAVISPLIGLIIDTSQSMVFAYIGMALFSAFAVLITCTLKSR